MWAYNQTYQELYHSGVKGMKWGYSYGKKNGNRIAEALSSIGEKVDSAAEKALLKDATTSVTRTLTSTSGGETTVKVSDKYGNSASSEKTLAAKTTASGLAKYYADKRLAKDNAVYAKGRKAAGVLLASRNAAAKATVSAVTAGRNFLESVVKSK